MEEGHVGRGGGGEGLILSMQVCCSTHWVCIDDRRNAVVVQVSLSSHHPLHTDDTYRGEEGGGMV